MELAVEFLLAPLILPAGTLRKTRYSTGSSL